MRKYAEIYNGLLHKIYEQETMPVFAPSVKLIDVTDIEPAPQEGWYYNYDTNTFSDEIMLQPTLEEIAEENLLETKYQTLLLEMML